MEALDFQLSGTADDLTLEYAYNPASQLVQHALSNNQYHHQGGWGIQGSYSVNGLNQYTDAGGDTVAHDDNGNLIQLGSTTYTYDPENRLTEVDGTTRLSYDPKGRLHQLIQDGETTTFLYDGDSLIAEYDGGLNRRYVHSTRVDTPLVAYHGSGVNNSSRHFIHRNHQGSVIALSDNSANVTAVNTYDAYGNPGSSNEGRFGYTGQMWLPELGLYHYRARVYAPEIGRFLQTDPVGYEDQMNLYAYVHNDPLNYTDPSGEFGIFGAVIGAGIEAGIQLATTGKVNDWKAVAVAGAVGAVTGGVGGRLATQALKGTITASKAVRTTAAAGGAANGVGVVTSNAIDGKATSATEAAIAVAGGAAGAGAGAKIANGVASKLDDLAQSSNLG